MWLLILNLRISSFIYTEFGWCFGSTLLKREIRHFLFHAQNNAKKEKVSEINPLLEMKCSQKIDLQHSIITAILNECNLSLAGIQCISNFRFHVVG